MKKLLMVSFSALAAFAFADRADSLSAAAYVQNGLVAQFDAIENAGVGVHDASATSWTDLKGAALANLQGSASWGPRRLSNGCTQQAISGLPALAPYSLTVEAALDIPQVTISNFPRIFSDINEKYLAIVYGNVFQASLFIYKNDGGYYPQLAVQNFHYGTLSTASDSTNYRLVLDGSERRHLSMYYKVLPTEVSLLSENWKFCQPTNEEIPDNYSSLRFYNRGLSDAELAHNALIDGLRFFSYSVDGTGAATSIAWASATWDIPHSGAAASPNASTNDYVRISNARVTVASTDAVALKGLSLEKDAVLELASGVEACVRVMYVNGAKIARGIYTVTGAGGTQRVDWLAGEGRLAVGGDVTAEIPTEMKTPGADGWYEVGVMAAEGGAYGKGNGYQNDGNDYEWFVGERFDLHTGPVYPVGAKLRLKGYVMLDTIPAGVFSEVDTSDLQYVIMTSDNVFADGSTLNVPAGATAYFQAATWDVFQGTNWLVSMSGAKSVYKGNIVNIGTLAINSAATYSSPQTFDGDFADNGTIALGNQYGRQMHFRGRWSGWGNITGFNHGCVVWFDTANVAGKMADMTFKTLDSNSASEAWCANGIIFGINGKDVKADNSLNINTLNGNGKETTVNGKRWRVGGHIAVWGSNTVSISTLNGGIHVVGRRHELMSKLGIYNAFEGKGVGFLNVGNLGYGTIYGSTNVNISVNANGQSGSYDYTFQSGGINQTTLLIAYGTNESDLKATDLAMLPARVSGYKGRVHMMETSTKSYTIPMDFTKGTNDLYMTVGCNGSGVLTTAPQASSIDVTFEKSEDAKAGEYAVARFTSGGSLLNGWTVTLNGNPGTSASVGGSMTASLKRDDSGIWLNVRKSGFAIYFR